jgi:hypothetical protein
LSAWRLACAPRVHGWDKQGFLAVMIWSIVSHWHPVCHWPADQLMECATVNLCLSLNHTGKLQGRDPQEDLGSGKLAECWTGPDALNSNHGLGDCGLPPTPHPAQLPGCLASVPPCGLSKGEKGGSFLCVVPMFLLVPDLT